MSDKLCPRGCGNKAVIHPQYGVCPCEECQKKEETDVVSPKVTSLTKLHRLQQQRDIGAKDTLQPFDGEKMNPDFVRAYPEKAKDYFNEKELKGI